MNVHSLNRKALPAAVRQVCAPQARAAPAAAVSALRRRGVEVQSFANQVIGDMPNKALQNTAEAIHRFALLPAGTEGYAKAEVTVGGVDTDGLFSKTMEARAVPGLFVIGEAVDVTGWLGGYNFQWAWSSGFAAGSVA